MHSKIEIVDILIADKLGRSSIYKELERRTHETWTCTNYRLDFMKKKKFIFIILVIVVVIVIGIFLRYQHTSPKRLPDLSEQKYEQVHSSIDYDQDDIDDQTDILQGALDYINTKPKYKSKYYNSGYSNDNYGVCTDVVAFAMQAAGYDLMQLVNEDIQNHPEDYDIQEPDSNIDFRRVKNLQVFFANNAESLTTDVSKTEQWQGGDIIIFQKHIGIVSDRRNKNGVSYVIHHNDPWQKSYEQDILEKRDDIVGHYRWK